MFKFLCALFVLLAQVQVFAADVRAVDYFSTPDSGHVEFVQAIQKAKSSIKMWMFSMSSREVIDGLMMAAKTADVTVILDDGTYDKSSNRVKQLQDGGVKVVRGSSNFSLTHAKTAIFDNAFALITTMNLTSTFRLTRDAGVRVEDRIVLDDLNTLFEADLKNAAGNEGVTPALTSDALVIAPTNALARLLNFINSAKHEVLVTVENFSDGPIVDKLIEVAGKGVSVKVIAPFCSLNGNPFFNFPALDRLAKNSVAIRVPPFPATADSPYIHQKMIVVDGERAFVGSENFSYNSLKKSREIGIIVDARNVMKAIKANFNSDWSGSTSLPPQPAAKCSVYGKIEAFPASI
jgi:phosphatidylserine/phosphatidylglycerophosphate/cardiolipin synthase-like enzyme